MCVVCTNPRFLHSFSMSSRLLSSLLPVLSSPSTLPHAACRASRPDHLGTAQVGCVHGRPSPISFHPFTPSHVLLGLSRCTQTPKACSPTPSPIQASQSEVLNRRDDRTKKGPGDCASPIVHRPLSIAHRPSPAAYQSLYVIAVLILGTTAHQSHLHNRETGAGARDVWDGSALSSPSLAVPGISARSTSVPIMRAPPQIEAAYICFVLAWRILAALTNTVGTRCPCVVVKVARIAYAPRTTYHVPRTTYCTTFFVPS